MSEVSSKPWSDFKESDYTLEQWRIACLISPSKPVDDFLAHYGVKGMRWGVRKERDGASGTSRKERKQNKRDISAQKFEAKAISYQKAIEELNREPAKNWLQRRSVNEKTKKLVEYRDQATKDAEAKRQGKMTDRQRKVVIGASAAAVILAAYGTAHLIQSGEVNRLSMKGKALLEGTTPSWKKNDILAQKDLDVTELQRHVVSKINPNYGAIGTKQNCRRATFAYEMRRRGYDVSATRTTTASGQNVAGFYNAVSPGKKSMGTSAFSIANKALREETAGKSAEPMSFNNILRSVGQVGEHRIPRPSNQNDYANLIFTSLATQPDRARGEIGVKYTVGGGHSMAWEIVRGVPVIFDNQTGKVYRNASDFAEMAGVVGEAGFTRLDNLPLNNDYLMRWLKNASS